MKKRIFAALLAVPMALGAAPAIAQDTGSAPPPASSGNTGGFALDNLGQPTTSPVNRPQVQGPVDPDAPIATQRLPQDVPNVQRQPQPRQQPLASQPSTSSSQRPAITIPSPQASSTRPATNAGRPARREAIRQAAPEPAPIASPPASAAATDVPQTQSPAALPSAGTANAAPPLVPDNSPIMRPGDDGPAVWPWWLAALMAVGAGLYWMARRNSGWQPEVGVPLQELRREKPPAPKTPASGAPKPPVAPAAKPQPAPAPAGIPVAKPAEPVAQAGAGIEIRFVPDYVALTFKRIAVNYVLALHNPGGKPVNDITIRTALLSASDRQDQDVAAFVKDTTAGDAHEIAEILPGETIEIEGDLAIAIAEAQAVRYGERILFVPVIACAVALMRGETKETLPLAYMIGTEGENGGSKMGPFRLDKGPRTFSAITQRPLAFAAAA